MGDADAGEAKIPAFLEDVAALGNAALTLHEVTLERRWLDEARRMAERAVRDFRADDGLFYDTPREEAGGERLVIRPREIMDGATPSGTSLAAELCLRLGHLLEDEELLRVGREAVEGELDLVTRFPTGHGRLMSLAQALLQPPVELAVVGEPDDPRTRGLLDVMLQRYVPERTITGRAPGTPTDGIPLLENREMLDGPGGSPTPTAWLCRDYACERPVTDPRELEEQFGRMEEGG